MVINKGQSPSLVCDIFVSFTAAAVEGCQGFMLQMAALPNEFKTRSLRCSHLNTTSKNCSQTLRDLLHFVAQQTSSAVTESQSIQNITSYNKVMLNLCIGILIL